MPSPCECPTVTIHAPIPLGHQADLFATPIVPGLAQAPGFLTAEEEAELIAKIDAAAPTPFRFQGWTGKRLTRSYGWSYDFETGVFSLAEPIPDWLQIVKARAEQFAGLESGEIVQALIIRYDPGASIGWHKDRPVFDHVIGISLGAAATLRLRRRRGSQFERASAPLAPSSVYHLSGEVRHGWEHSITALDETRWSITFRSFSDKGRIAAGRVTGSRYASSDASSGAR